MALWLLCTGEDKADMGHVVEAATVPPVDPNMPGMSLYRSPSKIMPELPSHTPHKAGQLHYPVWLLQKRNTNRMMFLGL